MSVLLISDIFDIFAILMMIDDVKHSIFAIEMTGVSSHTKPNFNAHGMRIPNHSTNRCRNYSFSLDIDFIVLMEKSTNTQAPVVWMMRRIKYQSNSNRISNHIRDRMGWCLIFVFLVLVLKAHLFHLQKGWLSTTNCYFGSLAYFFLVLGFITANSSLAINSHETVLI